MMPYDAEMVTRLVRRMSNTTLATASPSTFQRKPAETVIKSSVIAEIISNEKARRKI